MRVLRCVFFALVVFLCAGLAFAVVFGTVRGVVHDPQHRPIVGATVEIKSANSDWSRTEKTDANGEFSFPAVPFGDYTVTAVASGFSQTQESITLESDTSAVLHLELAIAGVSQRVVVSATPEAAPMDTVTPTTMLDREQIQETPGADLTNGMEMITDYVPAAYVTHDMLHMRGGHQVDWLIDGVPIPNTNIASNLGPQIDPKDIDYLEVLRGSYDADYGDRTYGMFNIVPKNGFEFNRDCDLDVTVGNFYQTDDQVGCGGHTERLAYYFSLNGNRSNYGLQTPIPQVVHDADNGYGGFGSIIYNLDAKDQLRVVGSLRQDYYQIPIDPDPNSTGNQITPSYGLRDSEREPDGYVVFSWVHTFNSNTVLTVSPFYHYNSADYEGGPNDYPAISNVNQAANYGGAQASFNTIIDRNDIE
ncbi:MAG: carboxypeptidase regulatory-like domain-containing protein, partial [Candidatus Acidiferrales bacterium]